MAFRFQRRIRLFPGLRLNLSKSGVGVSTGVRGARVSAGRRGIWSSVGAPGTGMSFRKKHGAGQSTRRPGTPPQTGKNPGGSGTEPGQSIPLEIEWKTDGSPPVVRNAQTGQAFSAEDAQTLLRSNRQAVIDQALARVDEIEQSLDSKINIHAETPAPGDRESLIAPPEFDEPKPAAPNPESPGLLTRLVPAWRRKFDDRRAERLHRWKLDLEAWDSRRVKHEAQAARFQASCNRAAEGDPDASEDVLEMLIEGLDWPYETEASLEIIKDELHLEVDLPEIEDLPTGQPRFNQRDLILSEQPLSQRAQRMNYARHVHAIAVRLLGMSFAALPWLQSVVISGFSQRLDKTTGHTRDEYLYSVRADRPRWEAINFDKLAELDPIDVLEPFEHNRNMTKTGIFRPIEPLD